MPYATFLDRQPRTPPINKRSPSRESIADSLSLLYASLSVLKSSSACMSDDNTFKKGKKVKGKKRCADSATSRTHLSGTPAALATAASVHLLNSATREQVSQYAMLHSIRSGAFEDVKFYAFSRRGIKDLVNSPRPLFANSALICKASSHFDFVLSAGFAESSLTALDAPFPPGRASYTLDYDYLEDSDLEDGDSDDESDDRSNYTTGTPRAPSLSPDLENGESLSLRLSDARHAASINERGVYGESLEQRDAASPEVSESCPSSALASSMASQQQASKDHVGGASEVSGRKGRVVFIEDIAYRTWEAFIFYTYFGKVSFAPLRSQKQPVTAAANIYEPPPCSPKSMYRLADKYGIDALKELAADDIKGKVLNHNIFLELFSPFAAMYPTIQDTEVESLRSHIAEDDILRQIPQWLRSLEAGSLPRGSAAVFSKILTKVASRGVKGYW
ncbi:hypothetical protein OH77DRAFT_1423820 [Trametes cingulata]|nr:hypothetical protein OH77DRAFT_1423820 [Trametes cingulata]